MIGQNLKGVGIAGNNNSSDAKLRQCVSLFSNSLVHYFKPLPVSFLDMNILLCAGVW